MPARDGIDVSHYQNEAGGGGPNSIHWQQVSAAGVKYVIVKISEQVTSDAFAVENVSGARGAGILVGGYHFLRNSTSGAAQAQAFLQTVAFGPGDLVPSLDIEVIPSSASAKAGYVQRARAWVAAIRAAYGRWPFIYTRRDVWQALGNPTGFDQCPLWLPRYGPNPPQVPQGWSSYVIWQFSQTGSVNGITGNVDEDNLAIPFDQFRATYCL